MLLHVQAFNDQIRQAVERMVKACGGIGKLCNSDALLAFELSSDLHAADVAFYYMPTASGRAGLFVAKQNFLAVEAVDPGRVSPPTDYKDIRAKFTQGDRVEAVQNDELPEGFVRNCQAAPFIQLAEDELVEKIVRTVFELPAFDGARLVTIKKVLHTPLKLNEFRLTGIDDKVAAIALATDPWQAQAIVPVQDEQSDHAHDGDDDDDWFSPPPPASKKRRAADPVEPAPPPEVAVDGDGEMDLEHELEELLDMEGMVEYGEIADMLPAPPVPEPPCAGGEFASSTSGPSSDAVDPLVDRTLW